MSHTGKRQKTRQHAVAVEVLMREVLRRGSVLVVVRFDLFEGCGGTVDVGEGEQPESGWDVAADSRLLDDDRPAGGQVTGAAVAEPSRASCCVAVLDDAELTAGMVNVIAVRVRRRRMLAG